ncbi:hypothetical protein J7904_06600 [Vibrio parahaemolyticus]|nr:hypothetical protein [Vibrio parahaemolyticus]MCF9546949.1 hypothetical protein [Vibrio parahaemolyticus]
MNQILTDKDKLNASVVELCEISFTSDLIAMTLPSDCFKIAGWLNEQYSKPELIRDLERETEALTGLKAIVQPKVDEQLKIAELLKKDEQAQKEKRAEFNKACDEEFLAFYGKLVVLAEGYGWDINYLPQPHKTYALSYKHTLDVMEQQERERLAHIGSLAR